MLLAVRRNITTVGRKLISRPRFLEDDLKKKKLRHSLLGLLGSALPLELYIYKCNPFVYHSLRIWEQCRKMSGLLSMSIWAPIYSNHMSPPSMIRFCSSQLKQLQRGLIKVIYNIYFRLSILTPFPFSLSFHY